MIRSYVLLLLMMACTLSLSAQGQSANAAAPAQPSRQLTLSEAEELLRVRSLAVAANRYQLDASRTSRVIAGLKPNPVLTLGAQQLPFTTNIAGSVPRLVSTNPDAGANPTFTAHVDKPIERGGKRELRMEQADAIVDTALAQIEDTLRTQRFQLRQAFVAALLARDNLQIAAQLQEQYAQTVTLTGSRVGAGNIAPVELYRIQAASLPFQQGVLDAQGAYEQATRDLLNLLDVAPDDLAAAGGRSTTQGATGSDSAQNAQLISTRVMATAPVEVQGTLSEKAVALSLAELRALALSNRPDVKMARSGLRAASSSSRLAQAQRSRDLVVGVEYQRVGNDQAIGVTTQIPLFAYNNQQAGVTQAVALERAAETQLRQAERQAVTDVDKAYQAYLSASRMLALYNDANLSQVADVRRVTAYTYERGAVSLFELLDAERMVRQTLSAYNQARASYQLALFQLEQATGAPIS